MVLLPQSPSWSTHLTLPSLLFPSPERASHETISPESARARPCRELSSYYLGSDAAVGSTVGWYTVCVVKQ